MILEWKCWTEEFINEKQSKKDFRKFIKNKMKKRGKK